MYRKLLDNTQYTSVINDRHYQRLNGYIDEAEKASALAAYYYGSDASL